MKYNDEHFLNIEMDDVGNFFSDTADDVGNAVTDIWDGFTDLWDDIKPEMCHSKKCLNKTNGLFDYRTKKKRYDFCSFCPLADDSDIFKDMVNYVNWDSLSTTTRLNKTLINSNSSIHRSVKKKGRFCKNNEFVQCSKDTDCMNIFYNYGECITRDYYNPIYKDIYP